MLKSRFHQLLDRNTELEAEIVELRQKIAKKDFTIEFQDKRIKTLEQVMDELMREKYAIESELENLRGY